MRKDSPFKIFFLVLLVLFLLLPWRWMPALTLGDYEVKRIDLLSDLISTPSDTVAAEALPALVKVKPARRDTCPPGVICIDDYEDESGRGMSPFYAALARRHSLGRPVRVAYLGDSFIEVDILTASLRRLLQQAYGGSGVGYLDMAPPYAANRSTVTQRYGGWDSRSVLDKGHYDRRRLNLSQRYFLPKGQAWTEITGIKKPGLDTTEVHTIYLRSDAPLKVGFKADNGQMYALRGGGSGRVEALTHTTRSGRVKWQVTGGSGITCWGVAEESRSGVIVDNYSLRGSGGNTLVEVPEETLREFAELRPYDLIVVQYGLNVVNKKQQDYSAYTRKMRGVIDLLKRAYPEAGILVVGVGDREDRLADGQLHTLPAVLSLMRYQQNMAAESHVAFWNLYKAMGGKGAIKRMAEAKPAEAGKDYTHINMRGGERVAKQLFKSLSHGYQQYQKYNASATH